LPSFTGTVHPSGGFQRRDQLERFCKAAAQRQLPSGTSAQPHRYYSGLPEQLRCHTDNGKAHFPIQWLCDSSQNFDQRAPLEQLIQSSEAFLDSVLPSCFSV
jgi:hypothetical protein